LSRRLPPGAGLDDDPVVQETEARTGGERGYALLDAGDGRRLERFGARLVDRPAPVALGPKRDRPAWAAADLRFDVGEGWSGPAAGDGPWLVEIDGLTLELRAMASGGLGLFPEHAANLGWLRAEIAARKGDVRNGQAPNQAARPEVLNLFAHTGLATLAAAAAGAAVTHVDSARASVAWARRNAGLSGLEDRPVRWLVDDALAFVEREARRGRRYDGVVMDPPTFGRAAGGGRWSLRSDLWRLLEACATISRSDAFVLVTAHAAGLDPEALRDAVADAFGRSSQLISPVPLGLEAESGAELHLGWAIRLGTTERRGSNADHLRNRAP
jgi:23S rRNA (cytosine1962-C5)-methyltransferase